MLSRNSLTLILLLFAAFLESSALAFIPGHSFNIVSRQSGKCLDITDHSQDNGALFQQWDCRGEAQQTFRIVDQGNNRYQIINPQSGRCLSDPASSQDNGARMVQWDCGGGADQQVEIMPSTQGSFILRFVASNKCMDLAAGSPDNGAVIHQWDCNGSANQDWHLKDLESNSQPGPSINDQPYYLVSKHSDKCLDVRDHSLINGGLLQQWQCVGEDQQKFRFLPQANGLYMVQGIQSGRCLDVAGASMDNGAALQQWDCVGVANQMFSVAQNPDGTVLLKASHNGKCVDVSGPSIENGALVHQWDCVGQANQAWTLKPLSENPPANGSCPSEAFFSPEYKMCFSKSTSCDELSGTNQTLCESREKNSQCFWDEPTSSCLQPGQVAPEMPDLCQEGTYYSNEARECIPMNRDCVQYSPYGKEVCESREHGGICDYKGHYCGDPEEQSVEGTLPSDGGLGLHGFSHAINLPDLPSFNLQTDSWECGLASSVRLLRGYGHTGGDTSLIALKQSIGSADFTVDVLEKQRKQVCKQLKNWLGVLGDWVCHWTTETTRFPASLTGIRVGRSVSDYATRLGRYDADFKYEENVSVQRIMDLIQENKPVIALHLAGVERKGVSGFSFSYPALHYFVINGYDTKNLYYIDTTENTQWMISIKDFESRFAWRDWAGTGLVTEALRSQGVRPGGIMYINRAIPGGGF